MESKGGEKSRKGEEKRSEMTEETLSKIKWHCCGHRNNEPMLRTIHDNASPGYQWLLPGWVAEERHMTSGRVYRYYYDREGRQYRSQAEVLAAWEKIGVVVIDN
ncbi:hypothetical protein VNO78_34148 [Psophocarpus tetragonolobus]|uniref:MBD domain-containing protein n=1 Tax=Psophocarpus tetragonolobus TaxID=3891 RepID=A0AAN9NY37_PSOTE